MKLKKQFFKLKILYKSMQHNTNCVALFLMANQKADRGFETEIKLVKPSSRQVELRA